MSDLTRRAALVAGSNFILASAALAAAEPPEAKTTSPEASRISNGRERPKIERKAKPDKGPPLDQALVFEFVSFAHSNLDVVKDMLVDTPRLVNCVWDWGGGDFETALGAAGHMGRRDIAELLIQKGARLELPAAAMLGQLEFVKAALAANPIALKTPGPHGIPLIVHAKNGGEKAAPVLAYLQSLEARP